MCEAKKLPTSLYYALPQVVNNNALQSSQIARLLTRNFFMDDFFRSVPSADHAVEIYKSLRAMLAKEGFHLTIWISNFGKTLTTIDRADTSPSSSKTFEAESTYPSILGLQWSVGVDNQEVCRNIQKGILVKITRRAVLSQVSAVFGPLEKVSPFTIRMRLLLSSKWKENGQSWNKKLNEEY